MNNEESAIFMENEKIKADTGDEAAAEVVAALSGHICDDNAMYKYTDEQ